MSWVWRDGKRTQVSAPFFRGDKVRKKVGYKWPGVVVASYTTLEDEWRVVVECTAVEIQGAQHIFNPNQLELQP